jgi:hypothetical protein
MLFLNMVCLTVGLANSVASIPLQAEQTSSGKRKNRDANLENDAASLRSDSGAPFFAMELDTTGDESSNSAEEQKPGISLTIPSDDDEEDDEVGSDSDNRCKSVVSNPLKVRFRSVSSEIGVADTPGESHGQADHIKK